MNSLRPSRNVSLINIHPFTLTSKKSRLHSAIFALSLSATATTNAAPEQPDTGHSKTQNAYISGANFTLKEVTYEDVNGVAMFEGDIILGTTEKMQKSKTGVMAKGVIISGTQYRWPNNVIPYQFDTNVSQTTKDRFASAVQHWQSNTHIILVQRKPSNAHYYPDYIEVQNASGCASGVGRYSGEQPMYLASACSVGNIIHEIGHIVGLWHEQSREDRDAFVSIQWENIAEGKEHNFNQSINNGDDAGNYDYGSIMHYPSYAFSKNGQPTIVPLENGAEIGQRTALSAKDLSSVYQITRKSRFGKSQKWQESPAASPSAQTLTGDVNGDGRDDIITFASGSQASVTVSLSEATQFGLASEWHPNFSPENQTPHIADVNGDGQDDIIAINANNEVFVALSNGAGFNETQTWQQSQAPNNEKTELGDVNGDKLADLISFSNDGTGDVYVALSNGSSFNPRTKWNGWFAANHETTKIGDVNGDGLADLIAFANDNSGDVYVALSNGTTFNDSSKWLEWYGRETDKPKVADVNGDGLADIISFTNDDKADVYVALSTRSSFTLRRRWHTTFAASQQTPNVGDTDGDGNADILSISNDQNSEIYVALSSM